MIWEKQYEVERAQVLELELGMNTGFVISCVTGQITSPEIHLHLKNKYDAHLVVVFED